MRPIARVILPVLALLVLASGASAQDMPDIVRIDIELHWTVPAYGAVSLSGINEWQNGVGYTVGNPQPGVMNDLWHVTGVPPSVWFNFSNSSGAYPGQFVLSMEGFLPHDLPEFHVPLNGQVVNPVVLPGDYAIGDATFLTFAAPRPPGASPSVFFAESGHITVVPTPELAVLRSVTKHIGGRQLNALVTPTLQRVTAWGAAAMLRAVGRSAVQRGIYVDLSSVSLEVQEWCSGLASMKWLLLLALVIALVGSGSLPWKLALVLAAPLIALEANMLRVAGVGVSLEIVGRQDYYSYKDWIGWAAIGLGAVQVLGLAWLVRRFPAQGACTTSGQA